MDQKASLWQNNIIKRQNEGFLYRKVSSNDIWNLWPVSWVNPFKNMQSFRYSRMSFLWTKKPPFDKITWSNDKPKVSFTEKWAWKIFGTFDENPGLARFKICKFFDYTKTSFLWTKKPPFDKTTWSNDKTKDSDTEK